MLNLCLKFADTNLRGFVDARDSDAARPYGERRSLAGLQCMVNTDSYVDFPLVEAEKWSLFYVVRYT